MLSANVIFWGGLWVIGSIAGIGIKESIKEGKFGKYTHRALISKDKSDVLYAISKEIQIMKEDNEND